MKLDIENDDVDEIKDVARSMGVVLTNEEAVAIFYDNRNYAGTCYMWGIKDTESRGDLYKILVKMGKLKND